jgi:hypothetical protein
MCKAICKIADSVADLAFDLKRMPDLHAANDNASNVVQLRDRQDGPESAGPKFNARAAANGRSQAATPPA